MVEALGGEPLEEGVGVAAAAHAVYHLGTVQILLHHLIHGVDVILPVAVDGNGDIAAAAVQRLHQACQYGILVAAVAALRNADEVLVLLCKALNELPGLILGAVVDEQHPAPVAHKAAGGKVVDLLQEQRGRDGQHCFLIITGDHDPENRFGHGKNSFLSLIAPSASERPGPAV